MSLGQLEAYQSRLLSNIAGHRKGLSPKASEIELAATRRLHSILEVAPGYSPGATGITTIGR